MPSNIVQAIDILNESSLADQALMNDLVTEIVNFNLQVEAKHLVKKAKQVLGDLEKNAKPEYQYLEPLLQQVWQVAIPLLSIQEVEGFLARDLLFALTFKDYPLKEQLSTWLRGNVFLYDERDRYKQRFRQLLENDQLILTNKRTIKVGGVEVSATVAQWLKDYKIFIGQPSVTTISSMEYLFKSPNLSILDERDRDLVRILIDVYEYLLTPVLSPRGFDEPIYVDNDEGQGVYKEGIFQKIDEKSYLEKIKEAEHLIDKALGGEEESEVKSGILITSSIAGQQLLQQYHKSVQELFDNAQIKAHLQALVSLPVPEIIKKLNDSAGQTDQNLVLACLLSLIRQKNLPQLAGQASFKEWQADFLKNYPGLVAINLTNPEQRQLIMSQFIKMVLQEQAKLGAQASAMAFTHLANLLKNQGEPGYLSAAYANLKTASFNWREIEVIDGKLKYK